MPDWTYHPFLKPLLFRMPAEDGRRLTLAALRIQGSTAPGRWLFRLFGHVHPPETVATSAFGLRFASPVGLGPGIDTDGAAAAVLQYLGFGFLTAGPAGATPEPRRFATEPRRIEDVLTIAASDEAAAPAVGTLAARLRETAALAVPVGVALRGADLVASARQASGGGPRYLMLPARCAADDTVLAELRAATALPLLLRVPPDLAEDALDELAARATAARLDGFVAVAGVPTTLLPGGTLHGPLLRASALRATRRLSGAAPALPVVAAAGVASPDDALELADAGARLFELYDGLVYAGPGLPGRIVAALDQRARQARAGVPPRPAGATAAPPASATAAPPALAGTPAIPASAPPPPSSLGAALVAFTGFALIAGGLLALALAATRGVLPPDERYLGLTFAQLCAYDDCRVAHFMVHDRFSFAGALVATGLMYQWLGRVPLRRGEPWAFWTLALSGAVGFASFLTYVRTYFDPWHAAGTLALLPCFTLGLALCWRRLAPPRGPRTLFVPAARAWRWSPAARGRIALTFAAAGMILGGATIMVVGTTTVFVPQDLAFLGLTRAHLDAISPRLVPLIAHDRAGFGGALCSAGLAVLASVWCGARPGEPGLWRALLAAGLAGFATAIGIHPLIGYTTFSHLLPAYAGALAFLAGATWLHRSMCRLPAATRFPDLL
jgi:dihydroorotate dehydrogenase